MRIITYQSFLQGYSLNFKYKYIYYGLYVFPCPSKAEIMYKYKVNVNLNTVSRLEFLALSNGTLGFPLSSVLYAENRG